MRTLRRVSRRHGRRRRVNAGAWPAILVGQWQRSPCSGQAPTPAAPEHPGPAPGLPRPAAAEMPPARSTPRQEHRCSKAWDLRICLLRCSESGSGSRRTGGLIALESSGPRRDNCVRARPPIETIGPIRQQIHEAHVNSRCREYCQSAQYIMLYLEKAHNFKEVTGIAPLGRPSEQPRNG